MSPSKAQQLQLLDVSVFGPFKSKPKIAFNYWHIRNVGKPLSNYNKVKLTKTTFLESFTPRNIASDFSKIAIWPFNRLAFGNDNFAPIEMFDVSNIIGLDLERQEGGFRRAGYKPK